MATTTWKQLVYDFADAVRKLLGTTDKIPVGQLASKINSIPTQAKTYIKPGKSAQVAASAGTYLRGDITIGGDSNLIAENIKKGVNIFGVDGILAEIKLGYDNVESGEFTCSTLTDVEQYTITHNLGVVPKLIVILSEPASPYPDTVKNTVIGLMFNVEWEGNSGIKGVMYSDSSLDSYRAITLSIAITNNHYNDVVLTETSVTIYTRESYYYNEGATYRYIIAA